MPGATGPCVPIADHRLLVTGSYWLLITVKLNPSMRSALVVMARHPEDGAVKTRLARVIGAARARLLYRAFLSDIERRFAGGPRTLVWAYHPPEAPFASVVGPQARCLPQRGADLAERMHNGFRDVLAEGFDRVLMIGADVPHVAGAWLDEAEACLGSVDVVLGPSADGGYYLVAMRAAHDIFRGVALSTNRALAETMDEANRRGLTVHLLPASFDIDEAQDLDRLARLLDHEGYDSVLPATAGVMRNRKAN